MDQWTIFLWGAAGALAPEVIRLYTIARNGQRFTWSWFYIIASFFFAALGGAVALLLPAENMRSAFYTGVSTPVLITTAAKKVSSAVRKKRVKKKVEAVPARLSRFDSFLNGL